MGKSMEQELIELAHVVRVLTVRHALGQLPRAEYKRELGILLAQHEEACGGAGAGAGAWAPSCEAY